MTTLDVRPAGGRTRTPPRHSHHARPALADLAVLFDLDGILVDSELLGQMAERAVMDRLDSDITRDEEEELLGCSMQRTVQILLARAQQPVPPAEVEAWLDSAMLAMIDQHGVPMLPGARELLAGVRDCRLPHALVTSTGLIVADKILERADLAFRYMVTGNDVKAAKPDPEPYLKAAAMVGVTPARCVALEDSRHGIASAEAAGCRVIAVPGDARTSPAPGRMVVSSLLDLRATPDGLVLASLPRTSELSASGTGSGCGGLVSCSPRRAGTFPAARAAARAR